MISSGHGADPVYEMKPLRSLSDRDVSAVAAPLLRSVRRSWTHAESRSFMYHAASAALLAATVDEAEWCYTKIASWLPWPSEQRKGRLFIFDDRVEWEAMMRSGEHRKDGVAFHVGREIYILRGNEIPERYIDLPHEMVHYHVWQTYQNTLPLWLEEGLAVHFGWELASAYQLRQGLRLYRENAEPDQETWLSWDEVLARRTYPADPIKNRAFYWQAGQLVAFLAEVLSDREWVEVVQAFAEDPDVALSAVLHELFGWSSARIDAMKQRVSGDPLERITEDR